jgi:DNA-binding transcriptional MerR regulator
MTQYFTCGQAAKRLRISVSTLKRWLAEADLDIADRRNCNGWRLFTAGELDILRKHKKRLRSGGKRFNDTTLIPVVVDQPGGHNG